MSPADGTTDGTADQPATGRTGCVLVAAGSGTRLGLGVPKALARAGPRTLLELVVATAAATDPATGAPVVDHLVVVVPGGDVGACTALVRAAWTDAGRRDPVVVVAGGEDRQASVAAGCEAMASGVDVVLVHDAARALAPVSLFATVAGAVRGGAVAVVPGLTPADTVKRLRPAADTPPAPRGLRTVADTLDRAGIVAVQTPQGFRADVLRELHRAPRSGPGTATDDAGLAEAAGLTVCVVPGHPEAFKVTTPLDLVLARALLQERVPGQDGSRDR